MARAGAGLVVAGRSPGPLRETAAEARALGARPEDNAPLLELGEEQWDRVVDLNLKWTLAGLDNLTATMAAEWGHLGTVDDIGPLCVYLASDEAAWLTGEVIQFTGGSRIPVGYLSYLHRVNERLGWEGAPEGRT